MYFTIEAGVVPNEPPSSAAYISVTPPMVGLFVANMPATHVGNATTVGKENSLATARAIFNATNANLRAVAALTKPSVASSGERRTNDSTQASIK